MTGWLSSSDPVIERASELARTLVTAHFEGEKILRRQIVKVVKGEPEAVIAEMLNIFTLAVAGTYDSQEEYAQYLLKAQLDTED
jgi:hypothetical protein